MKLYEINSLKEYDFSCIYLWTNLQNGKKYVGQSQSFYRRMMQYKDGHFNRYMGLAIDKYGLDNFDITILERDIPLNKLDEREQYWLDYYQSYKKEFGYNICQFAGTTRGYNHTDEAKELMSQIAIERFSDPTEREKVQGENNGMYGKRHSKEWCQEHSDWMKAKWKDAEYRQSCVDRVSGENNYFYGKHFYGELNPMYGKHHSQQTKDKISQSRGTSVRCIETGVVYPSMTKAAQDVGVTRCVVSDAVYKGYKAGGYHWEIA